MWVRTICSYQGGGRNRQAATRSCYGAAMRPLFSFASLAPTFLSSLCLVVATGACGGSGSAKTSTGASACAARLSGGLWTPLDPKLLPTNDTGAIMANASASAPIQYTGDGIYMVQGGSRVLRYNWSVVKEAGEHCTLRQSAVDFPSAREVTIQFEGADKYKVLTEGATQATQFERKPQ